MEQPSDDDITSMVQHMRISTNKNIIKENIINYNNFLHQCVACRHYLNSQSTGALIEKIIKNKLNINNIQPNLKYLKYTTTNDIINETDTLSKIINGGDGYKNNIIYEIKYSGHSNTSKCNFVQIRPNNNIDYYILIVYSLQENIQGKYYIIKIPSQELYELLPLYGSYAHGSKKELGPITLDSIYNNNFEYALRPNLSSGKYHQLWLELLKYETTLDEHNF